jgi:putative ABC transport system permease protein
VKFILNMARREMRASWRRLIFFFVCIGVGVGAIVALRSIIQNINRAVAVEARQIIAADVQIDSSRAFSEDEMQALSRILNSTRVAAHTDTVELPTMARAVSAKEAEKLMNAPKANVNPTNFDEAQAALKNARANAISASGAKALNKSANDADANNANDANRLNSDDAEGAMMVELKAVAPPFPLAGELALENQTFDFHLLENNGALVAPLLLSRLKLKVGEFIKVGDAAFQIRGVIAREPGGGSLGFRLGPRVFIHRSAIDATGLTGYGSRARHKMLLTVRDPAQLDGVVNNLRQTFKGRQIAVSSYKDSQDNLRAQFSRAENFLSLTGLIVLVLGGIGVANVTRIFIEQKKRAIAALKVLGGTNGKITAAYLLQIIALGVAGSAFGVALARVALLIVEYFFADSLPKGTSYSLSLNAVAQGMTLGFLISALFAALPLLRVRKIKPNSLLREMVESDDEESRKILGIRFDWRIVLLSVLVVTGLFILAAWQANSWRIGASFVAGLFITLLLLQAAASALIWFLQKMRLRVKSFALRQAISALERPGNQTRTVVVAVGLGVFLMLAAQSLERNLLDEFNSTRRTNLPNLYAFDILPEQKEAVTKFIETSMGEHVELVPIVRARVVAVNGREIDLSAKDVQRERFHFGREYAVTYRANLEPSEYVTAGKFWDATPLPPDSPLAEISIEEGLRGVQGLDVGSTMTLDVLGRRITARVTSIREVDWNNARTGFMILFRPGTLENAPHTFVAPLVASTDEIERGRFQTRLVERFPNVAVIDVGEILKTVRKILDQITLAVSFIGAFVFLSGALILIGSISMTKYQRVYETAVLKTLGAQRNLLLLMLVAEYALLGIVAAMVGAFAAVGLSYATTHYVLEINWSLKPLLFLIGIAAAAALVTLVGAFSSFDVLTRKPLVTLRAE